MWTAAWKSSGGIDMKSLGGIDLKFDFTSKEEASMWLRLNIPRKDWVGVLEGDLETLKAWIENQNATK